MNWLFLIGYRNKKQIISRGVHYEVLFLYGKREGAKENKIIGSYIMLFVYYI